MTGGGGTSLRHVYCFAGNTQLSNAWELEKRERKALLRSTAVMLSVGPLFSIKKEHVGQYMTVRASSGQWDISAPFSFLRS